MMRLATPLILAGVSALIQAQTPSALGPAAQVLERDLRELKGGLLVVVDGPKAEWRARVEAMTADPEWVDLDMKLSYYGSKAAEVEALLRSNHQAGPRPQWVLFGEGGRVVAAGGTLPDAKGLMKLVEESGIRTEFQLLREFIRRNPDHLEAKGMLLRMLNYKASQRTSARLGRKGEPLRPTGEAFDLVKYRKEQDAKEEAKAQEQEEAKPPTQLGPEEDRAIWGEMADLLAGVFRNGDWLEMESWELVLDERAAHSPLMQDAVRPMILEVERALAHHPGSWARWQVWLSLTNVTGGKPIRPLLDSLTPLPTLGPTEWPPYAVRDAYVKDARQRKDWTGIRDLLLPQIESDRFSEAIQGKTTRLLKTDGKIQEDPETGDYWRSSLEPLVEALVRLGDTGQADDLVRDRYARHPWPGLPAWASSLALRCNLPNLAAQWGGLASRK